MTQYIVDAPPRTGKSQYMIYLIDKFSKKYPNRHIVTNIIGINYPGVISVNGNLHNPVDWRDYPNGTIFIYDEAHEHPAFSADDLMKDLNVDTRDLDGILSKISNSIFDEKVLHYLDSYFKFNNLDPEFVQQIKFSIVKDKKIPTDFKKLVFDDINKKKKLAVIKRKEEILDIGRSLTLHGHFGFDIYLITQDVKRLNQATIAATSVNLKLRRLFGWPMMLIYKYSEVQKYFAGSTRSNAIGISLFFYRPYLYKYYISSEEHNVPKSYPTFIILLLVIMASCFFYGFTKLKDTNPLGLFGKKESQPENAQNSNSTAPSPVSKPTNMAEQLALQDKIKSCMDAYHWTYQQCEQSLNPSLEQKRNAELLQSTGNSMQNVVFEYNSNKPYDTKYQPNPTPTDFPRLSNAIVYNGKCHAYSQQGTLMNEISQSDCRRFASGDHPFDYFKNQNNMSIPSVDTQLAERVSTSEPQNQNNETSSL